MRGAKDLALRSFRKPSTREQTVIVILAAGKSTRLGGTNKLLVQAAGMPVHEWHRLAVGNAEAYAVVRPDSEQAVRKAASWLAGVITHDKADGPCAALLAASEKLPHGPLTVLYADTLLPKVPTRYGDWVGVAPAPWRVWDYYDHSKSEWTRGVPQVQVCCGVYQFTNRELLNTICHELKRLSGNEVHMAEVLKKYTRMQPMYQLTVEGWQDAGDLDALKLVKQIKEI